MMKKRNTMTNLLVLALCVLSGATSGLGLWWIFDQNTELLGASIVFAIAATTILQALIVQFWDWAAAAPTFRRRMAAALFGAFVSLASAGFAAGAYVYAMGKTAVETQQTQQNATVVTEPLARFGGAMRGFSGTMLEIANDARQKSSIESQFGGSCSGDRPEQTCGPKCRLRKRHAQEAESFSAMSRSMAGETINIIAHLQSDLSREGMLRAFTTAQDLANHPNLSKISSWLRQEITGFNTQFLDPDTRRPFVCRDPDMLKKMSEALAVVTRGFVLPSVPPEPATFSFRQSIGKSYEDAFALARMLLTGKIDPARHQALAYSYAGYVPALAVELLIVALVFFRRLAERDRGGGWTSEDIFAGHVRNLPSELRARYRAWIYLILGMMLEERNMWYFARPIDGTPEVVRQCAEAAIILDLPVDSDMKPAIPLKDMYPEWAESRADIHGGARWFVLHPLTKEKHEWLRKAARDLADVPKDVPSAQAPNFKVVGGIAAEPRPGA